MFFIGNQSAYSAKDTMTPFQYAIDNKFRSFEWFPDKKDDGSGWVSDDLDFIQRSNILNLSKRNFIRNTVHAPWWASVFTQEGRAIILKELDFSKDIGAEILNLHLYTEETIEHFVNCIKPIAIRASEYDIKLSIENTTVTSPEDFNKFFYLWNQSEESKICKIGMCLDIGHANLFPETRNDYISYFNRLNDNVEINHLHFHENYGDKDSHLTLFTGPSQHNSSAIKHIVSSLLDKKYKGSIVLEQWPNETNLLNQAKDKLEEIIKEL
jgi:sugar phosphate isomerase/epimerase